MTGRAVRGRGWGASRIPGRLIIGMMVAGLCVPTAALLATPPVSALASGSRVDSGKEEKEPPRCAPVVGLGATRAPELTAKAWAVVDAGSGRVLASCRAHDRLAPASTQKVLTALTLLPKLDPDSVYVARKQDAEAEGSGVGLLPGHGYTITQLAHGLILRSGNDAASALANAFGGWKAALAAMNAEAARLGAVQTGARNPSGLDAPGQVSSAADLATIFRAALAEPRIRKLLSTREADFPLIVERPVGERQPGEQEGARKVRREVRPGRIGTIDPLVWNRYPGLVGGKTGYTTNAGRTYVAAVQRGGRTLIVSLLGYTESTEDEAHTAFSWAFAHAHLLAGVEDVPVPRTVSEVSPGEDGAGEDTAGGLSVPAPDYPGVALSDSTLMSEVSGGLSAWSLALFLAGLVLAGSAGLVVMKGRR